MLKDTAYDVLKRNEQAYEIMLLREQLGMTFLDIAKELKLSVSRASQIYRSLKVKQIRLYIAHISATLGHNDDSQIRAIFKQAEEYYGDRVYACAYLERKYEDILNKYRNGEPGMPQQFFENMPPFKTKLSKKTIARVIEMREAENASFKKISIELRITQQKAKNIYYDYYHSLVLNLFDELCSKAESSQEESELWDYCFRNKYSSKKRYERLRDISSRAAH